MELDRGVGSRDVVARMADPSQRPDTAHIRATHRPMNREARRRCELEQEPDAEDARSAGLRAR